MAGAWGVHKPYPGRRGVGCAVRTLAIVSLALACSLALSGCFSSGSTTEPAGKDSGSTTPAKKPTTTTAPRKDPNLRWHYHNYWGTSSEIVLMDVNLSLPVVRTDRLVVAPRTAVVEFTLPYGKIVPPEAGELNVTIRFAPTGGLPFTGLNFSYRPGGAVNFTGMKAEPGKPLSIPVTYDQTDVPHRSTSAWKFRLGPEVVNGLGVANGTAHISVAARIGRPLLIDPPHFDQWRGRTAIPLAIVEANVSAVKLADDRYAVSDVGSDAMGLPSPRSDALPYVLEIPLPNGSLVPERTFQVVVHLFWNLTQGSAKPMLAYAEENSPSNGTLQPAGETETSREYRVPIKIGMTDSPYANASTWRFYVLVEGTPGSTLKGSLSLHAIAERRA